MSTINVNNLHPFSGDTVNINEIFITNGVLSGTTFYGDGSNLTGISGGSASVISVTYSELTDMITGNTLSHGSFYLISDFKTCYDRPEYYTDNSSKTSGATTYVQGSIEPIIVLGTSSNTISSTAYQPTYPNDRIQYDWTWNQTEISLGAAYGRITERIDEFGNRTDYDHRTIEFIRFESFDKGGTLTGLINGFDCTTGVLVGNGTLFLSEIQNGDVLLFEWQNGYVGVNVISASTDTELVVTIDPTFTAIVFENGTIPFYKGLNLEEFHEYKESYIGQKILNNFITIPTFNLDGSAIHNYIGDYSRFYIEGSLSNSGFLLANNVFYSENSRVYSNIIGDRSYNNNFTYWFLRNTIGGRFYNNVGRANGFYSNSIGEYFNNNKINDSFYSNSILESFERNNLFSSFYSNTIKNNFSNNLIFSQFYLNQIGTDFTDNTISNNNNINIYEFKNNKIINGFSNNFILQFENNNIENNFYQNTSTSTFSNNVVGYDFKGNLMVNDFSNNIIAYSIGGNNFSGSTYQNLFGPYIFNNDFLGSLYGNKLSGWFYDNLIGDNFNNNYFNFNTYQNIIGSYFGSNISGLNFYENNIGDYFGYDDGDNRPNRIGDNFTQNEIGNRFCDNNISNNFIRNTIANSFQYNNLETNIGFTDFTVNLSNITSFTYVALGSTATDNTYDVSTTTNISGINATFNVVVTGGLVISVNLNDYGSLYQIGEVLTVLGSQIGGTDGVDDITITITDISQLPSVYERYTTQIFERKGDVKRLSFYDESDILNITNIYE